MQWTRSAPAKRPARVLEYMTMIGTENASCLNPLKDARCKGIC